MNLTEIDDLLQQWRSTLDAISANLNEVEDLFAYKVASGFGLPAGQKPDFEGETALLVPQAVEDIKACWVAHSRISNIVHGPVGVDQKALPFEEKCADALRENIKIDVLADKTKERIIELLRGQSIKVPKRVPLAQRSATTAANDVEVMTPSQAVERINALFGKAKATILRYDAADKLVDHGVAEARTKLEDLTKRASAINVACTAQVADITKKLDAVARKATKDPLGAAVDFTKPIGEAITALTASIERLEQDKVAREAALKQRADDLARQLDENQTTLIALRTLNSECTKAWQGCRERIANPPSVVRKDAAILDTLETMLKTQRENLGKQLFNPVEVGIRNWRKLADEFRTPEEAARQVCAEQLRLREALKGELRIYNLQATSAQKDEDPQLKPVYDRLVKLIYEPPTPMDEAAKLLRQYKDLVNSLC